MGHGRTNERPSSAEWVARPDDPYRVGALSSRVQARRVPPCGDKADSRSGATRPPDSVQARKHSRLDRAGTRTRRAKSGEGIEAVNEGRVVPIPVFIDVHDVMRTMKCSRSNAYAHMRAAIGRRPGERGQLRVPIYVWQQYVERQFEPARAGVRRAEQGACPIPITQARTKPTRAKK